MPLADGPQKSIKFARAVDPGPGDAKGIKFKRSASSVACGRGPAGRADCTRSSPEIDLWRSAGVVALVVLADKDECKDGWTSACARTSAGMFESEGEASPLSIRRIAPSCESCMRTIFADGLASGAIFKHWRIIPARRDSSVGGIFGKSPLMRAVITCMQWVSDPRNAKLIDLPMFQAALSVHNSAME